VRILLWHVHGSWTTAFVHGHHEYVVPVVADRGTDGVGIARTFFWPDSVVERSPEQLRDEAFDVVILQRERDIELCERWTGRRPGRDVPAVWVEHNAPQGRISELRHPMADRSDLVVAHVTHFNDLFWECGTTRTVVIEHGIVDPGYRFTGELARAAVVINEPIRRGRVTGTDLLPLFAAAAPLDLFGMKVEGAGRSLGIPRHRLAEHEDVPQAEMHSELARRRVYVHPLRWTSLGLSLLEAMHLGMPVVGLATTEAIRAVPPEAGVVDTDVERLVNAVRALVNDEARASAMGEAGRAYALEHYGLGRFSDDWDKLLGEVVR
jgi:hypothetical protein